jgi:hypothetical protein
MSVKVSRISAGKPLLSLIRVQRRRTAERNAPGLGWPSALGHLVTFSTGFSESPV